MFSRLSIRARITLGSLAAAAILLVLALAVVRIDVRRILTNADQSLATSDLTPVVADIVANPTEPVDDPGTGVLLFVRDPTGAVQVNTLPQDVFDAIATSEPTNETLFLTDDDERSFVVAGRTVATPTGCSSSPAEYSCSGSAWPLGFSPPLRSGP
jgi:two-component system OmpR family sensor kinase